MKSLFPCLTLIALTACATPQESCISDAQRHISRLNGQIATAEGNIARGYALATVQDTQIITVACEGTNSDGTTFTFPCQETEYVNRQEPVAIDVSEERIKLEQLRRQRDAASAELNTVIQQCVQLYPE